MGRALMLLLAVALVGGCSDPKYRAARARRDARMRALVADQRALDDTASERIGLYVDFLARNDAPRDARQAANFEAIGERYRSDARRWRDPGSPFLNWYAAGLPGHPERIPGTWAKMVY